MALPINIEDLLNKRKVESNRIEFKASWNPDKIYHTICAFATDLENTGGGYILIGVEEENGIARRPVKGIDDMEIDRILKDMVGYDAKISPTYLCKVSPENIDNKTILVICLGDFLKELGLTEGRATGVPTIQKHLGLNGNNPAVIETDDDRTYFLMTIPCRKDMVNLSKTDDGDQDSTTSIQEIILLIKKELANLSLQVYSIDTEDVDLLSSRLAKLISQVYLQVWEKIRRPWSFLISDVIRTFLLLSIKDTAASDLLKESHTESLYKFKRYILEPAISAGYIEMSDPDKPRSSKQGYRLTQSGRLLFNS